MIIGSLKLFEKRVIGDKDNPLLIRYIIFRLPSFGIFLHKLCRSDHERALHDHPWPFNTLILRTGYTEVTDHGERFLAPGTWVHRPATWKHRVVIHDKPAWTLVFLGPRIRKWGFWPDGKWCWWRKYDDTKGICSEEILWQGNDD